VKISSGRAVNLRQVMGKNIDLADSSLDPSLKRGWTIVSLRDIPIGSYIYGLLGVSAGDLGDHAGMISSLSMMALDGEAHLLAGPARFLNHDCIIFNVEV
jgi:hypothetical protein